MIGVTKYDPDELALTKKDVLEIMDAVKIFWSKNKSENWFYISVLQSMKAMAVVTPEHVVKKIWNTMLKFIFRIQYENALQHAMKNKETWADTLSRIKQKIAEDGI